jgi:putative heme-binding domain-containing protein
VALDPELPMAIVEQPQFGRPGHVAFLSSFPANLAPVVQQKFFAAVQNDPEYPWTNDVVFLFAEAQTPEALALLRERYEHFNTRSAAMISLARRPQPEDRPKFVEGLNSSQPEVLRASLDALEKLPPRADQDEIVALIKSLRRLGTEVSDFPLRERVVGLLERDTSQRIPFIRGPQGHRPQPEAVQAWTSWAMKSLPSAAAELQGGGGANLAELQALLAQVDWASGNAARGKKLFIERSCSQCHGSSQALGPSLAGVAGRFSREDLFLAIALPDRDVSPRYQATTIETKSGQTHTGLIVYESAEGIILRNTTNQTFRFNTAEIESKYRQNRSLMPSGLLKDLKPPDLADLYRYLQMVQ